MTKRPILVTTLAPALLASVLLAGCSGDDEPSAAGSTTADATTASEPTPTTTEEATIPPIEGASCRARVTLTGAERKKWSGKGSVVTDTNGGPVVVYQSTDGSLALTAYGAGNGFDASVILNSGTASYSTAAGTKGMEIADDGSGASLDVDLTPTQGRKRVHVEATFRC